MIKVDQLCKSFGVIKAVDNVSFSVEKGDVLGFLGPNGAGKSTTMKMLSCFLAPDSGDVTICGNSINDKPVEVRHSLGYVAESAPAYEEMPVSSFLSFVCDARGVKGSAKKEAIKKVAKMCSIESVMHQPFGTLSKGYRRRVGLAQALVHDPDVLILDEPTDGLDPNQKHQVRELIKQLAKDKCIIVSTHILEEVDAICNRIIIIDRGQVLVDTTPQDIQKKEKGSLDEIFRKLTIDHHKKEASA